MATPVLSAVSRVVVAFILLTGVHTTTLSGCGQDSDGHLLRVGLPIHAIPSITTPWIEGRDLEVWAKADKVELFALSANRWRGSGADTRPRLRGQPIVGSVVLDAAEAKLALAAQSRDGSHKGPGAWCFEPRHALRVHRGGRSVDVLMCYTCMQLQLFNSDAPTLTAPGGRMHAMGTAGQMVIDQLLRQHRVQPEVPSPSAPVAEVKTSATAPTAQDKTTTQVTHLLNGVSGACFEKARLWESHESGEVELSITMATVGAPGSNQREPEAKPRKVQSLRDTTPQDFGRCVVREAMRTPLPANGARVTATFRIARFEATATAL